MRRRFFSTISLIKTVGPLQFTKFLTIHLLTSPKIWEWVFVKKIHGRKLRNVTIDYANFYSDDLVSVVLPVNNGRQKGVERLVCSLKSQTHCNIEYIAVDSGSTDDTEEWLRGEGFKVLQIKPEQFSHAFSRNYGAEHASGKYLLFVVDDVVFEDKDWVRSAIFLMEKLKADALSSRQTIDSKAGAYACVLDLFLANAQNDRPGINVSRNNGISTFMRGFMPLRSQFRSVSIDDTNHLVRRKIFVNLKFKAPTVEDIDFAIRMTQKGRKIIYTNLIFVIHYHEYEKKSLCKYARRVYIDTKVIARWQPYGLKLPSRESFLVGSMQALALILMSTELMKNQLFYTKVFTEALALKLIDHHVNQINILDSVVNLNSDDVQGLLRISSVLGSSKLRSMQYGKISTFKRVHDIFIELFEGDPPSTLFYDESLSTHLQMRLHEDIRSAVKALWPKGGMFNVEEFSTVCVYLWCNMVMSHMARSEIFKSTQIRYNFDNWDMGDWS